MQGLSYSDDESTSSLDMLYGKSNDLTLNMQKKKSNDKTLIKNNVNELINMKDILKNNLELSQTEISSTSLTNKKNKSFKKKFTNQDSHTRSMTSVISVTSTPLKSIDPILSPIRDSYIEIKNHNIKVKKNKKKFKKVKNEIKTGNIKKDSPTVPFVKIGIKKNSELLKNLYDINNYLGSDASTVCIYDQSYIDSDFSPCQVEKQSKNNSPNSSFFSKKKNFKTNYTSSSSFKFKTNTIDTTTFGSNKSCKANINNDKNYFDQSQVFKPSNNFLSAKINELNKEIVGHKLQLKFIKQLLKNIVNEISKKNNNYKFYYDINNLLDFMEKYFLCTNFSTLSNDQDQFYDKCFHKYNGIFKDNDNLFFYLESLQNELKLKNEKFSYLNKTISSCLDITIEMFQLIFQKNDFTFTEDYLPNYLNLTKNKIEKLEFLLSTLMHNLKKKKHIQKFYQKNLSYQISVGQKFSKLIDSFKSHIHKQNLILLDLKKKIKCFNEFLKNSSFAQHVYCEKLNLFCEFLSNIDFQLDSVNLKKSEECSQKNIQIVDISTDPLFVNLNNQVAEIKNNSNFEISDSFEKLFYKNSTYLNNKLSILDKKFDCFSNLYDNLLNKTFNRVAFLNNKDFPHNGRSLSFNQLKKNVVGFRSQSDTFLYFQKILSTERKYFDTQINKIGNEKKKLQNQIVNLKNELKLFKLVIKQELLNFTIKKKIFVTKNLTDFLNYDLQKFKLMLIFFTLVLDDSSYQKIKKKIFYFEKSLNFFDDCLSLKDLGLMLKIKFYHNAIFEFFVFSTKSLLKSFNRNFHDKTKVNF